MNVPESSPQGFVEAQPLTSPPPLAPSRPKASALLLPPPLVSAWSVASIWILPQLILLAINFGAWGLIKGEVSTSERSIITQFFVLELISLVGGVSVCAWLWLKRTKLPRLMGLFPLVVPAFYLISVLTQADRAIPNTVADWMLPVGPWMINQLALVMPAVLFGGLRLLCPDEEETQTPVRGIGIAFLACVILVGVSYGYLFVAASLANQLFGSMISLVGMIILGGFFLLASLAAAAILRLGISLYINARRSSPTWLAILTGVVALAGPLGGLLLNQLIPFPSNFQQPEIYILAAINGILLLLPNFANPILHRITWLAQCLLFPFSVYFFAVFLPFLPLSPLAVAVMGAGLLMYVPSLLFFLHGYRIYDGYRAEIRDGHRIVPLALGIAAILAWPITYTVQARLDRGALLGALDHLRYPNYSTDIRYGSSPAALRSALIHLQEFKQGAYKPFLSEYYNWLAFDNMVLPQKQIDQLARDFLGEPLPKATKEQSFESMFWGRNNRPQNVTEVLNEPAGQRPSALAKITSSRLTTAAEGGVTRANLVLEVSSSEVDATEFHTHVHIPRGAMIANFWLTIGTERVPGRLYEKRAAEWVYQKITEVRPVPRDPAILRYTGPEQAELRVYPVERSTPRIVEIEFLYPTSSHQTLSLGDIIIPETAAQATLATTAEGHFSVSVPPAAITTPPIQRQPYLHFLIDASRDTYFASANRLKNAIRDTWKAFPQAKEARLAFVNYETRHLHETYPLEQLLSMSDDDLQKIMGEVKGGFIPALGLKNIIWRHHLALEDSKSRAYQSFPVIVVVSNKHPEAPKPDDHLSEFAQYLPDQPGYWFITPGQPAPTFVSLAPNAAGDAFHPVHIMQVGKTRFATPAGQAIAYTSFGQPGAAPTMIESFSSEKGKFEPISGPIDQLTAPTYLAGLQPWSLELERIYQPYKHQKGDIDRLLKLCRQTGVLVPSAAYMVVENTAQWKMLERTEAKTTKAHESFSLVENPPPTTPEPSTIALLILGGGVIALHLWRTRRARLAPTS